MKNLINEKCELINFWRIESIHTPWWMYELSKDPDDKSKIWINIGYHNPMICSNNKIGPMLALSCYDYVYKFN